MDSERGVMRTLPPLPTWATVAMAWALYLPLSWQYLAFLGGALAALGAWLRQRLPMPPISPTSVRLALLWWVWMALSMSWSSAPLRDQGVHVWHYALPLCMLPLVAVTSAAAARQALRHFAVVSVLVAALLPWLLADRITGNQRIVFSLLLALAVVFAVIEARSLQSRRQRALWAAAALACGLGLVIQDRRSGMLALPLMLATLLVASQSGTTRRAAAIAAVLAGTVLAGLAVEPVRTRFAQGWVELQAYRSTGDVATSMGMRARLLDQTWQMVREHPVIGHGVGSWRGLWRERVQGGELLEAHTTPHNEYLLVAQQGGVIGLMLFVAAIAAGLRAAWRRGPAGHGVLMVWVAFALAALFNAALRDAKIALPLMLLGVLAWASTREPRH